MKLSHSLRPTVYGGRFPCVTARPTRWPFFAPYHQPPKYYFHKDRLPPPWPQQPPIAPTNPFKHVRFANTRLASLQAEACARIIGVASTKRGRAWAFRDSNSSRNANYAGGVELRGRFAAGGAHQEPIGTAATPGGISRHDDTCSGGDWDLDGCGGEDSHATDGVCSSAGAAGEEGEEADDGDAAAVQCFWRAWGLDGL